MKRLLCFLLALSLLLCGCISDPLQEDDDPTTKETAAPTKPVQTTAPTEPSGTSAPTEPSGTSAPTEPVEILPTDPVTVVETVTFDLCYTDGQEYGTLTAYDKDGSTVWSYTSASYPINQLDTVSDIGRNGDIYYIVEQGSILAFELHSGKLLWKNEEFRGSPANTNCALFDEEGILYICGFFGPDLFAVSKEGTTLHDINTIHPDYFWAYRMELENNWLTVYLDGGPFGDVSEEEAYRAHINLDTLGTQITSIEQAEALADAMYGEDYVLYRSWEENGGYIVTMRHEDTLVKLFVEPTTGILILEGFA